MLYNDKLKSLKCGRILPPSKWDGPDRLPMEVRSQHDKTNELFLSLWTVKALIFGQLLKKFLGNLMKLPALNTARNPSLKSMSRQRVLQHRISRQMWRKCLGSSDHSFGAIPISLYDTYCCGHSPALTNQNYVLKWRNKDVNEWWWNPGHRTCLEVCAYFQGDPDRKSGLSLGLIMLFICAPLICSQNP